MNFIHKVLSFFVNREDASDLDKSIHINKEKLIKSQPIKKGDEIMEKSIKWDVKKIKEIINKYSQEIKKLKQEIRQPHAKISSDQYYSLTDYKGVVTLLCAIRAASKGRIHHKWIPWKYEFNGVKESMTVAGQQEWVKINTPQIYIDAYSIKE